MKSLARTAMLPLVFGFSAAFAHAQKIETPRKITAGDGPSGVPQATFSVHRKETLNKSRAESVLKGP